MRAVRYHRYGGPEVLELTELPTPEAANGQVVIETEAIGVNAIDALLRRGDSPWPRPLPAALTGEVVGRITQVGPDAPSGVQIGQRVSALSEDAFAEQVVADAAWLAPIPDDADAGEATVISMTAPLALRALKAGQLKQGDTVLVQSAAGTVGHLAVQLARLLGAGKVIGTASSAAKLDFIRSYGAGAVDLSDTDWPSRVREIAPEGVDVVIDAVGGEVFDQGVELLAPLGRMVSYGAITGEIPKIDGNALFGLKYLTGVSMLGWRAARPEEARADIAEVSHHWQSGALRPAIHGTYPLTEIETIHKILDERTHQGRLIAVV